MSLYLFLNQYICFFNHRKHCRYNKLICIWFWKKNNWDIFNILESNCSMSQLLLFWFKKYMVAISMRVFGNIYQIWNSNILTSNCFPVIVFENPMFKIQAVQLRFKNIMPFWITWTKVDENGCMTSQVSHSDTNATCETK
jgi:hypothetical protein